VFGEGREMRRNWGGVESVEKYGGGQERFV
jgi:hypothetical protein